MIYTDGSIHLVGSQDNRLAQFRVLSSEFSILRLVCGLLHSKLNVILAELETQKLETRDYGYF